MADAGPLVRVATAADAASVAAVYAPLVRDTAVSFEDVPPSTVEMADRIEASVHWVVACEDEDVVGYAYATPHRDRAAYRWAVDCSVYLAAGARGRGVGRALYARLLPELAERGFVHACAGITLPNAGSVGLHEALGFRQVAHYADIGFKLGRWHDVGWWVLRLVDPLPVPPGPTSPPVVG